MILDTSFLIDVLRAHEAARELKEEVDEGSPAYITPISVMELWEGVHYGDEPAEEREAVELLLEQYPEAGFTSEAGLLAGEIQAHLRETGNTIETPDVMIGAIARHRMEPVVTANPDHFRHIPGLTVRTY